MNRLITKDNGYLTQIATDIPIEERILVKKLTGVKATEEYFREATDAEIEAWEEYKKTMEEQQWQR